LAQIERGELIEELPVASRILADGVNRRILYMALFLHDMGKGRPEDLDLLDSVADNIKGRTICALGDAAAMPVQGMLKHFRDEFAHHVEHKRCLVGATA
jgi:NADH-quinone oxidoreductase subunit F